MEGWMPILEFIAYSIPVYAWFWLDNKASEIPHVRARVATRLVTFTPILAFGLAITSGLATTAVLVHTSS